jgi:hypothetical protein
MKTLWHDRNLLAISILCACLPADSLFAASLNLNGAGQYVSAAADPNLTPSQFTLEAWVKVSATGLNTILSRGDGGNGAVTDYILQLSNDGGSVGNQVSLFAGGAWDASSSSIPLNTWTHVAVTYDGSNKVFYVNGVFDRSAPRTNSIYSTPGSPLYIGRQGSVCDCNFFNGSIAEVRIWNTLRTTNQIVADMNSSFWGRQPGLVAYYHFNEGAGASATDITGNGHTGTLNAGASWTATAPPSLGTIAALEGPLAGADSVVLASPAGAWTAKTNASWLHLGAANQSGAGSTNVIFTFDANPAASTRTGAVTIAGLTLNVTQAPSNYVAVSALTSLPFPGNVQTFGVAVDGASNVYIADDFANDVMEWKAAGNTLTNLVSSGLNGPYAVAVDGMGNVYIDDTFNFEIKEWSVTNGLVSTLVSGLQYPYGVAVDNAGNVYFDDTYNDALKEWSATSHLVSQLVYTTYFLTFGVAVDNAENVYFSDGKVEELSKGNTSPVGSFFSASRSVAVDGAGNVYAVYSDGTVQKWSAASNTINNVTSTNDMVSPWGITLDGAGNLYLADPTARVVAELPHAYLIPTPKWETLDAGTDALPPVVPTPPVFSPPFIPSFPWNDTTNPPWLTITSASNGVVKFSFTASTTNRTGNILLLGQSIPIIQFNDMLSSNLLYVGAAAGSNGVVLTVNPAATIQAWTASAQSPWLHLNSTSGSGSAPVSFTFDANSGIQRTGTVTIAGQTLTVVQSTAASNLPSILRGAKILGDGSLQFSFTNTPGAAFTVLFTTNFMLPLSLWTPLGAPIENPPGQYQFTDPAATNSQGFYNVRSP